MSFAAPFALALFSLGAGVVVLYILKVKRRPVTVPYLRLWASIAAETRTRSLFKRLRRLLSLLLQLLILACLVLALGQPSFDLRSVKKESIVVVLDVSASMQAWESEPGGQRRFDLLLEEARQLVADRSFEDEMMLVAASDRIDVLCPFNRNPLRLRDALEGLQPTYRSLDVEGAYAFAREVTRDRENPVLVFLSDGAAGAVEKVIAEDERARLVVVGTPQENVGIVQFSARKNDSLGTDYVLARVQNFGETEQSVGLELSLNGVLQKVYPRTLSPGEVREERFELTLRSGGTLRLHLDVVDALPIDNDAYAVVAPYRPREIVLITESPESLGLPFVLAFQAMEEMVDPSSVAVTPEQYASLTEEQRRADITICHGVVPEGIPARANSILIDTPLPDFLPAREDGVIERPEVWDWDREHLLNRYLNYRDLPIPEARKVVLEGGIPLVSGFDGPLLAAFDAGGRKTVYVGFDMTDELFPFRLAFPMLLRNAVAWFSAEEDVVLEASYRTGDVIAPLRRLPADVVNVSFFRGDAAVTRVLPVRDGRFHFDETEEPGPYRFSAGVSEHVTCVNLFDPGESDLRPADPAESGAPLTERGLHFLNREIWVYLALFGLLLWAAEWGLYHRRITE